MILITLFFLFIVLFLLLMVSYLISFKSNYSREKMTPFECGFDPLISRQVSFYISYYMFSLVFLVFDVEIVLLLPMVLVLKSYMLMFWGMMLFMFFMLLLIWGLMFEYMDCSLEWSL